MATPATKNLGVQNWFQTTLAQSCGATDTTLYLNATPTPTEGYLIIDPDNPATREVVHYTSVGGGSVTLPSTADRGLDGTTGQTHAQNVTVRMEYTASHFTAIQGGSALSASAIATTAVLSSNLFSSATATYANGANLGGIFNYMSIGGFKMMWGVSAVVTIAAGSSVNGFVTLPPGFFNTVQQVSSSASNLAVSTQQYAACSTILPSTLATLSFYVNNAGGATAEQTLSVFAIGI